jgi:hypothetical protein
VTNDPWMRSKGSVGSSTEGRRQDRWRHCASHETIRLERAGNNPSGLIGPAAQNGVFDPGPGSAFLWDQDEADPPDAVPAGHT